MTELSQISSYLYKKYTPKAILLHGSRARGDAVENSDYDLSLITESPEQIRPEIYKRMQLDVGGISTSQEILKSGSTPVWPCIIVFDDEDGLGKKLAQHNKDAFLKGPPPLTPEELENRRNFSTRLIRRIQGRGKAPLIRLYYLSDFYQRALRYWCEINKKWTMSAHLTLARIETDDPIFYEYLKDLWTDNYQSTVIKIHHNLFKESL